MSERFRARKGRWRRRRAEENELAPIKASEKRKGKDRREKVREMEKEKKEHLFSSI